MTGDVNTAIVCGNIVRDCVVAKTNNLNRSVCNFTVACSRGEKADFVSCKAWGHLADDLGLYGKKGTKVYVTGANRQSSHEDKKTGIKRYEQFVDVASIEFLSKKESQPQFEETTLEIEDGELPY